jgi:hypothetical protein
MRWYLFKLSYFFKVACLPAWPMYKPCDQAEGEEQFWEMWGYLYREKIWSFLTRSHFEVTIYQNEICQSILSATCKNMLKMNTYIQWFLRRSCRTAFASELIISTWKCEKTTEFSAFNWTLVVLLNIPSVNKNISKTIPSIFCELSPWFSLSPLSY